MLTGFDYIKRLAVGKEGREVEKIEDDDLKVFELRHRDERSSVNTLLLKI